MLDYLSLDAVAAVIREGSFDRAAAVLGVTPSAVSQRVRALEERLGAVLVIRAQPCRPSPIGSHLCAHLEQVRLMEGELAQALPSLTGRFAGERLTLRIAVNADSLNTWFAPAAARFAAESGVMLDLVLDDEAHTAERLRDGDVLAAVTSDPVPVQGCQRLALGGLVYRAAASPAFMARHFATGVDAATLAGAPLLRFDRRDALQARFIREALGVELDAPTHWIPSSQAFLDMTLAGLGWAMNPEDAMLSHLQAGRLVELVPGQRLAVMLYWQVTRIGARLVSSLTEAVQEAARAALSPPGR